MGAQRQRGQSGPELESLDSGRYSPRRAPGYPGGAFVQWKAVLRPGHAEPAIDSVLLNYLPKNVAPVVDDVTVQVGARLLVAPKPGPAETLPVHSSAPPPTVIHDRNSVAVRWSAHDDNDDQLIYTLYYRGSGETRWKLLKDKVTDKYFSFDANFLPDGGYTIKVVASDAPSNPPGSALTDERESHYFEVDTTPPRIDELNGTIEKVSYA